MVILRLGYDFKWYRVYIEWTNNLYSKLANLLQNKVKKSRDSMTYMFWNIYAAIQLFLLCDMITKKIATCSWTVRFLDAFRTFFSLIFTKNYKYTPYHHKKNLNILNIDHIIMPLEWRNCSLHARGAHQLVSVSVLDSNSTLKTDLLVYIGWCSSILGEFVIPINRL